ncbi:uncharacterized protein LOC129596021 [Paramacrobiotus metropolitanus]|uniref:uncharacterized protein LOC129596021 n=1 Tax=Paramacrobiotus metropolitanus TaxID=2943436 RepID=UPI0024458220|nr:uncharacterized protein LOC129596021 [Paramacrobiotus metropolitanus]
MNRSFVWSTFVVLAWCRGCTASELPTDWEAYISPEILERYAGKPPDNSSAEPQFEEDILGIDLAENEMNASHTDNNFFDTSYSRWPSGIVPFEISTAFTEEERFTIQTTLEKMSKTTGNCINFVPRMHHRDYVQFVRSKECSSYIGRQTSGRQLIRLAPACASDPGDIQHEAMHALGFCHEMSRPDRDQYIKVIYENIPQENWHNFEIRVRNTRTFGLPYDYASIMHYPIFAFSKDTTKPTIIPTKKPAQCIGQKYGISYLDVLKIKIAYGCLDESQIKSTNWTKYLQENTMCSKVALRPSEGFEIGKDYFSPLKTHRLTLQTDKNLVMYRECDGKSVFATFTYGFPKVKAVLNEDGQFEMETYVSAKESQPLRYWGSETWGYQGSELFVSDAGYFYLCNYAHGCYWRSSGHHIRGCNGTTNYFPSITYKYRVIIKSGENLDLSSTYLSYNEEFSVTVHKRRAIVVWRRCDNRQAFRAVARKAITSITLHGTGNLVAYAADQSYVWWSGTDGSSHLKPELRLYDNGFLYLCDVNGCYWQSSGFLDKCSANTRKLSHKHKVCATLWYETNYTKGETPVVAGTESNVYETSQDKFSSAKVTLDCTLVLYSHVNYGGISTAFTSTGPTKDGYRWYTFQGQGWDNTARSLRCYCSRGQKIVAAVPHKQTDLEIQESVCATLWWESNYTAQETVVARNSDFNLDKTMQDKISSVKVTFGCTLTLYSQINFLGNMTSFTPVRDGYGWYSSLGKSWDNTARSLICYCRDHQVSVPTITIEAAGQQESLCAVLWTDPDFTLGETLVNNGAESNLDASLHAKFSSAKVTPGCTLVAYTLINFKGKATVYSPVNESHIFFLFEGDGNTTARSIKCFCSSNHPRDPTLMLTSETSYSQAPRCAFFWLDANYEGSSWYIDADTEGNIVEAAINSVSSVKVTLGCVLVFYSSKNYRGIATGFCPTVENELHYSFQGRSYDNTAQSYRCFCSRLNPENKALTPDIGAERPNLQEGLCAVLWLEPNFTGVEIPIGRGTAANLHTSIHDKVSSARVTKGCQLTIYSVTDFQGIYAPFSPSEVNGRYIFDNKNYDNTARSVECYCSLKRRALSTSMPTLYAGEKVPRKPVCAYLWLDPDYSNGETTIAVDEQGDLSVHLQDKFSSTIVTVGCTLVTYSLTNFKGNVTAFTATGNENKAFCFQGQSYDNDARSVKCYCF